MNQQQFAQFRLRGTIDSLYNYTGVLTLSTTATLATAGIYELLMVNYIQTFTSLIFSYSTIPVNIYLLYDSAPAPVGIVDYGVLNSSGVLTPYILMLSQVIGKAKIGAMQAYNS
ncbi:MAG: thermopsin family protease, partial [Nitrososphaerota archaeon]|nr:thermopsin family protease [Nitrososphaerota archaeon]